MSRPENGWGEPSYSQDIADNYFKTHHEEETYLNSSTHDFFHSFGKDDYQRPVKKEFVANDEEYLNSLYDDNLNPSDAVVNMSYTYLNDEFHNTKLNNSNDDDNLDYGFEKDEDGFYIIPGSDNDELLNQNNLTYSDLAYEDDIHGQPDYSKPRFNNISDEDDIFDDEDLW